jgi:hypothetical protein
MAADRVLESIRQAAVQQVELLRQAGVDVRAINLTAFVSVSQGVVSVSTTPPVEIDNTELIPVNEPAKVVPPKAAKSTSKVSGRKPQK